MSLDPLDVTNFNNVQGQSKLGFHLGHKYGKVRGTLTATGGLATGTYNLVGPDGSAVTLPKGSTVTRVVYKVLTSFESGTDAATVALQIVAANDVKTATALSDGSNLWDAADLPVACVPVTPTISTWLTVKSGDTVMKAVVGVEALTQGKLVAYVEYLYWGDLTVT